MNEGLLVLRIFSKTRQIAQQAGIEVLTANRIHRYLQGRALNSQYSD